MTAIVSHCGRYLYRLERDAMPDGRVFACFCFSPSTADPSTDDAVLQKLVDVTIAHGGSRLIVGNVFAYRANEPRYLRVAADPVGPNNIEHLKLIISDADVLVSCWGGISRVAKRLQPQMKRTMDLLLASGKPVMCFGRTACGNTNHPLFGSHGAALENFQEKEN